MLKSLKVEKIVFLMPANAIKSNIVMKSILTSYFYKDYSVTFCFDKKEGENIELAKLYNASCLYTDKSYSSLREIEYDLLISCAWGWLIPIDIINKSKVASLNCHSSYLPDYKGGSAYNHYWANCEDFTGATVHFLNEKFDEGNILTQELVAINKKDTANDILIKVSHLTSALIRESILLVEKGDKGFVQKGGRYFFKVTNYQLYFYRAINKLIKLLKINATYYTKHKVIR